MGTMMMMSVTGFVDGEVTVRQVGEPRVASFSVAVSRKNRAAEKQTLFVRVNCWNRLVLLGRAENGDSTHNEPDEQIPF